MPFCILSSDRKPKYVLGKLILYVSITFDYVDTDNCDKSPLTPILIYCYCGHYIILVCIGWKEAYIFGMPFYTQVVNIMTISYIFKNTNYEKIPENKVHFKLKIKGPTFLTF
jgi:hypothetical protein